MSGLTFPKKTIDTKKLVDFLEYVRLHPILNPAFSNSVEMRTDKVLRKYFNSISKVSQSILKVLEDLSASGNTEEGWAIVETNLKRAELHAIQQEPNDAYFEIKRIQSNLATIQTKSSIASILSTIDRAAYYAAKAPDSLLPKRRHSERVKANQLALDLKRYLKHHFSTQSPTVIATVVNTAFDLYDDGITADDVRKLKA